MFSVKVLWILFTALFVHSSEGVVRASIPPHLLPCYRRGLLAAGAPRRLDVFLTLLRRLELNSTLDLRLLSADLLRSLRLDGIEEAADAVETEFVLPYRASAFQFHRFKILMDLFLPSQDLLDITDILSAEDNCLLHKMLSSTVRRWERGDEGLVCPLSVEESQNFVNVGTQRVNSRCPIEDGVIQTDWGTISPGTLVSAVAAALEAQRVSVADILNADLFKEDIAEPLITSAKQEWYPDIETLKPLQVTETIDISNIWVATLAGDLAEVVVNQGPRVGAAARNMIIGNSGRWNDTLLPRDFYIYPQNKSLPDWHFTDAEILAGIDGFILANYVPSWVEQRRTLRLSQIIQMYYSNEGSSFDSKVRACNRQNLFTGLFNRSHLFTETSRFAHILSLRQGGVYVPVEEMDRICEAAVTAFMEYVTQVFTQYHRDCEVGNSVPVINLIVATDSSWKSYATEQFLSWVGSALAIGDQRGSLALLHSNTGRWIVPPSDNLTTVFSHLSNFTDQWPVRLNLPNILTMVIEYSLNKTILETSSMASAGHSTVVLIVSPVDRPSAGDLERARALMHTLRDSYFDLYLAYASQDLADFQNINSEYLDYSELFLQLQSSNVQDVISTVDTYLVKTIIPMRIIGAHCPFNGTRFDQVPYEDFVIPNLERSYRIHPYYLRQQPLIIVQFRNAGQGRLLVCSWRGAETSHNCQRINEREPFVFNLTKPCPSPNFCPPARFTVTALTTQNLCASNDCILPNQVGYYIQHTGLRCLPLLGCAITVPVFKIYLVLSIIISFFMPYSLYS